MRFTNGDFISGDNVAAVIAMKPCATLDALHKLTAMPLDVIKKICYDLISDLRAMHEKGVVHCDIRTPNIVLYDNKYRLIDFDAGSEIGQTIDISAPGARKDNLPDSVKLKEVMRRAQGHILQWEAEDDFHMLFRYCTSMNYDAFDDIEFLVAAFS